MPPKRKRTDESSAEAIPSTTRTTRSAASSTAKASASKSAGKKTTEDEGNQLEAEVPPAKKTRTTKASAKTTAAAKATKTTTGKKSAVTASKPAEKTKSADDDAIAHKKGITESQTPTTIGEPPLIPVKVQALPPTHHEVYSATRAQALFKTYEDKDESDVIGAEGFSHLCMDANMSMEGALPLILAWQLGTKEMMKITAEEWKKGTESLKISSLPALALAVSDLDNLLIFNQPAPAKSSKKDPYNKTAYWKYSTEKKAAFHRLYLFCFNLVKPEQSKNIEMETAMALWSVLLVPQYPLMGEVVGFIGDNAKTYKAANKDLWSMMLEFCETVNPNLTDYENDGAWPTLLDDFVSWKQGSTAANA